MVTTLQTTCSNTFSWKRCNGLAQIRRQAIICTNDGLVWCHTPPQQGTWPQWASELLCNVTSPMGKKTLPVNVVAKQNDCYFVDDIFKFTSSFENCFRFSLGFVSKGPINDLSGLVKIRARRWSCDKPWSELIMSLRTSYGLHEIIHTPNTLPHVMNSSVQQRIVPNRSHTKSQLPSNRSSTHLAF